MSETWSSPWGKRQRRRRPRDSWAELLHQPAAGSGCCTPGWHSFSRGALPCAAAWQKRKRKNCGSLGEGAGGMQWQDRQAPAWQPTKIKAVLSHKSRGQILLGSRWSPPSPKTTCLPRENSSTTSNCRSHVWNGRWCPGSQSRLVKRLPWEKKRGTKEWN